MESADGTWTHNTREASLDWRVDVISRAHSSGVLEFTVKGDDADAFFPLIVQFQSTKTLCDLSVNAVITVDDDTPLRTGVEAQLTTDNYVIV